MPVPNGCPGRRCRIARCQAATPGFPYGGLLRGLSAALPDELLPALGLLRGQGRGRRFLLGAHICVFCLDPCLGAKPAGTGRLAPLRGNGFALPGMGSRSRIIIDECAAA